MRLFAKLSLALAALLLSISIAPAAKADQIVIVTSGFSLHNLGNDGTVSNGLDSLVGLSTETHNISDPGTYQILLNPMTFTTGFTGANSGGPHSFTFSQLLTVNGQTQTFNLVGRIDIDHLVDTVHILSATPLTFNFGTFSVAIDVITTSIQGWGEGTFCANLLGQMVVTPQNCNPVPEPATLTLLGIGLMGAAAKLRQRRKSKHAS